MTLHTFGFFSDHVSLWLCNLTDPALRDSIHGIRPWMIETVVDK